MKLPAIAVTACCSLAFAALMPMGVRLSHKGILQGHQPLSIEWGWFGARADAAEMTTYRSPNTFSIAYPADWLIQESPVPRTNILLFIWSRQPQDGHGTPWPDDMVKTDVTLFKQPFNAIVKSMTSSNGGISRVLKSGKTKVGGREAFRAWIVNEGEGMKTIRMTTVIRYGNNVTATVSSYYMEENPDAVPIIEQIHGSFKVLP